MPSTRNDPTDLLDALANAAERVFARFARLDPGSDTALQRLNGRSLRLGLRGAPRGLRLRIAESRLRPIPDDNSDADLGISVEPAVLAAWWARRGSESGLPAGIRIEGDLELARTLERAIDAFDPDWELPFVDAFGTTAGPALARATASALRWTRAQAENLTASAAEFATEEARLVATRSEIDDFNADVDRLRDDVERLRARIERIARRAGTA